MDWQVDWRAVQRSANKEHSYMLTRAIALFSKYESIPSGYVLLRQSSVGGTFSRFFTAYSSDCAQIFMQSVRSHINAFYVRLPALLRTDENIQKMHDMLFEKPEIYLKTSINTRGIEKLQCYSEEFQATCKYAYFQLYAGYIKRILGQFKNALQFYIKKKAERVQNEIEQIRIDTNARKYMCNYTTGYMQNLALKELAIPSIHTQS